MCEFSLDNFGPAYSTLVNWRDYLHANSSSKKASKQGTCGLLFVSVFQLSGEFWEFHTF